jgi:hypothetical protein
MIRIRDWDEKSRSGMEKSRSEVNVPYRIQPSAFWDPKNFGLTSGKILKDLFEYKIHRRQYLKTTETLQSDIQNAELLIGGVCRVIPSV